MRSHDKKIRIIACHESAFVQSDAVHQNVVVIHEVSNKLQVSDVIHEILLFAMDNMLYPCVTFFACASAA